MPASTFPPPEGRPYSRTETNLKLENLEQRIDSNLDKILLQMTQMATKEDVNTLKEKLTRLETDNIGIKGLMWAILGILLAAAFRIFLH